MRAPGSLYSKGIGSVASSLPLAGPNEGSILEIFELMSVWAEQPIFSYQLLGDNGGAIFPARMGSWDLRLGEHRGFMSASLGVPWFQRTRLWLGETPPPLAGFQGPD